MELTKVECEKALENVVVNCCCKIRKCIKDISFQFVEYEENRFYRRKCYNDQN